ncbi:hypothetical protein I5Q34_00895 [Streptomyces sp. AV19]|uniref:hypothetical protein n=1 Tax=Streptomyces sp. AV19 TaxID=2793068 RepID=UPI0018FE3ACD|nr:hypothetical protein [Streptomyces sp. AV19]MBH1932863.1 hypothetical protein [Streptomyces sp. AV19]MDG4531541.1 hypothetical protein [Streptomyces sp. AV19]
MARATLAATATVLVTTVSGALLLCAFTASGAPDGRAAARCAAGAPGACVGGAPASSDADHDDWAYAAPTALPTDPSARARYPITVAPLTAVRSSDDGIPRHSGPPMDGNMAVGGGLVLLGSGLALGVLYRSRVEG